MDAVRISALSYISRSYAMLPCFMDTHCRCQSDILLLFVLSEIQGRQDRKDGIIINDRLLFLKSERSFFVFFRFFGFFGFFSFYHKAKQLIFLTNPNTSAKATSIHKTIFNLPSDLSPVRTYFTSDHIRQSKITGRFINRN